MKQEGRRYVVGLPKCELKKYAAFLSDEGGWQRLSNGVEIRWAHSSEVSTEDSILLCRSPDRRAKEAAIHERFSKRIEISLGKMARRLERSRRPVDIKKTERQIGRLLERNQRAGKLFDIRLDPDSAYSSSLRLHWQRNGEEENWAKTAEGCYALRTNVKDWSEADVWKTYIQLTQVEDAFRIHKSQLVIRPIWHHREDRVQAHIFVCFLAYVLWKTLEGWQSRAGLGNSPRTILEELGHISSADVVLPTTTGEILRLRCIVRPEKPQEALLQRLGLDLPQRMRIPVLDEKM